jgi:cytochrome oxidase assembly protein ShyY1
MQAPARKRRGLPFWPTVLVAVAAPLLMAFGFWQLQRAEWKAGVLTELERNVAAPLLPLPSGVIPDDAQFRLVALPLSCPAQTPDRRAGRNEAGQSGYAHLARCTSGGARPLRLDVGWTARPDALPIAAVAGTIQGRLVREDSGWLLVASGAASPRSPSAAPGVEAISDNHLSYAIQWFSFAAILLVIYGLHVRRWRLAGRADGA